MFSEFILGSNTLLLIGMAIAGVTLIHAAIGVFAAFRQHRLGTRRQLLELDLLMETVRTKRIHREAELTRVENVWSGFRKFRISKKQQEGGGICSFYLVPHDGKPMPGFAPGQYLTFRIRAHGSDKPTIRCYSLSDSSQKVSDHYRVSIKKIPPPRDQPDLPSGLSSSFFHDQLGVGDIVDARAPSGNFVMDISENTPVVLIGGGVGITPVLCMLNTLCDSRSKREIWFFYGVRNRSEHIMAEHLKRIEMEYENVHIQVCYSQPESGKDEPGPDYHHGEMVSVDLFKRVLPSNNFEFYICGPPPMMEALVSGLGEWGVPEKDIHFEAFGPASVKKPVLDQSSATESLHKVNFAKSGKVLEWKQGEGTLLELAEARGIHIDSGCRAGSCGTCMTAIKAGEVSYLDQPSASLESGSCLPCIAVPRTAVTIDA